MEFQILHKMEVKVQTLHVSSCVCWFSWDGGNGNTDWRTRTTGNRAEGSKSGSAASKTLNKKIDPKTPQYSSSQKEQKKEKDGVLI